VKPSHPENPPRIAWVDYAKGVGIVLVVVGHTLRGLQKTPVHVPGWEFADAWIYAFHMPLFFFLAGLFVEHSCRGSLGQFIDGKARRILWPYFVWTILQEAFRHLVGSSPLGVAELWTIIFRPVMQFWFLYVLFLLLVLYATWRKVGGPWQWFIALAFALNLSLAFGANYGPWGVIYQMWINIPYLALGILVSFSGGIDRIAASRTAVLAALAVGGYFLIAAAVFFHVSGLAGCIVPLAAVGILSSITLSGCLARWRPAAGIATLGVLSLEIFVAHTIFASSFRQMLLAVGIHSAALHLAGGIGIGLAGPVILYAFCKRYHLQILFSIPSKRHA
jgi:fucose 4-O-acetylase-like acetyltransferase